MLAAGSVLCLARDSVTSGIPPFGTYRCSPAFAERWGPWGPDGEARALCSMHVVVARSGVGAVFVSWYSSYSDTKVQVLAHNRDFSLTELSSSILSPLSRSLRVLPRHDWGVFLCGIMGGGDDGERSHRLWAHLPTLTPNREDTL